ncbi:MAG: CIA30 family protein [Candidatus Krumholzibacteriia bacterium]
MMLPSALLFLLAAGVVSPRLVDATDPSEPRRWQAVHDTVMGGLSQGGLAQEGDRLVFSGHLSLANNGGFASVRTLPRPFPLADHHGILLRVRGDGRTYQLRLRDDDRFDGPAWRFAFSTTDGEWVQIAAPFSQFEQVFRGRRLGGGGALDPSRVRQLGLMVADKQAGPFRLEIETVTAY